VQVVQRIPEGAVTNYGEVAKVVSGIVWRLISAQVVGWMLSGLSPEEQDWVPWQRVVNKKWFISSLKLGDRWQRQISLLQAEGVPVIDGYVDMKEYKIGSELFAFG
jgi:alkylated DNA nucleotide flippase Atl1